MKYQQQVGHTRTALIFNLDLIFASLFGFMNKESLSLTQMIGGGVIFIASMLESIVNYFKKRLTKKGDKGA